VHTISISSLPSSISSGSAHTAEAVPCIVLQKLRHALMSPVFHDLVAGLSACSDPAEALLNLVQGLLTKAATEDTQGSICSILAACTQISNMSVCAAEVNATASSLHESCCLTFAARVIFDKLAAVCSISWKGHPALTGSSCKTQSYSTAVLQMEALWSVPKKTVHGDT